MEQKLCSGNIEQKKFKANEIPLHAYRLYVKLYCERKGENNKKTIREAKRTWLSLSLSEKKLFYKTSAEGNLLKYAHGLHTIKTFLKEKKSSKPNHQKACNVGECQQKKEPHASIVSINETNLTDNGSSVEDEFIVDDSQMNSRVLNENEIISNDDIDQGDVLKSLVCDKPSNEHINDTRLKDSLDILCNTESNQENSIVHLDEPAPPTVMSGKDLYTMLKDPEGENWIDMSGTEKSKYNAAIRALKREYIKNYTTYLESLSQQQLFDHYRKTLY